MDKYKEKKKTYIIMDMELGDSLDNIIFMHEDNPILNNNVNVKENEEKD